MGSAGVKGLLSILARRYSLFVVTDFFPSDRKYQRHFLKEPGSIGNAGEIECCLALVAFPPGNACSSGCDLAVDLGLALPRKSPHGRNHK
jgi:hypothetical protein